VGLLWLLFNTKLAITSSGPIPWSGLFGAVAAIALVAFAFPRFASSFVGWLWELLVGAGKYW
jgi:hypothetical protein